MSIEMTQGIWGSIAAAGEPRSQLARELVKELDTGLRVLDQMSPAVTFFGGARVSKDDPYYAAAERMGELLADAGIAPRTGAGPGIMSAVPEGFRRQLGVEKGSTNLGVRKIGEGPQPLTQGFNIILPFEQEVNPAIDLSMELGHFPTRKLMLYQNCLGLVIFPGGFGTLDELLEVWRLKASGSLTFPVILYGSDFWAPFKEALERAHEGLPELAIGKDWLGLLQCSDCPAETIEMITSQKSVAPRENLFELGHRIARELVEGLDYLDRLAPAVTVLGGSRFRDESHFVEKAGEMAAYLASHGTPTRAAGPGPLSVALARGGHRGQEHLPQQAFGMRRDDARNLYGADRVHLVGDRLTHKVLLTEGSKALVAFPGSLGTLDELFSILCQLQTRTVSNRRIVLIGESFWTPILEVIKAQMFEGDRQTISAEDLDLMTITDDPLEAAKLALTPPEELSKKMARGVYEEPQVDK